MEKNRLNEIGLGMLAYGLDTPKPGWSVICCLSPNGDGLIEI